MKRIVKKILKFSAKIALKRNNYKIIAITGSAGKTSTKKAISLVLKKRFKILSLEEGYNTEFGLPLVLIGKKVPESKLGWLPVVIIAPFLALKKRDYDFCVLEMGADRPGDIEYLASIAKPDIAVVTNVSGAHLEEFKTIENVAKEKAKLLSRLTNGGYAAINADDKYAGKMKAPETTTKVTYGRNSEEIKVIGQDFGEKGSANRFSVYGRDLEIKTRSMGEHILYVFAAAIAVGVINKVDIPDIKKALEGFEPARGRLNILKGLKNSIIIDDSYNASPASMKNALDVLAHFKGRKIAALGSMGELGSYEKEAHQDIGRYLIGKCDILVTVGSVAENYLAASAVNAGMQRNNVRSFENSTEAGEYLKNLIRKGDVTLLKGSQNASRMEKAVKIIMKNPEGAGKLLCRQGGEWRKRD